MKTLLDLAREYAGLHEAKTLAGGTLPPESEKRWFELKHFYDQLMLHTGLSSRTTSCRFTADDIRRQVTNRARLRVRADMDVAFLSQDEYYTGLAVNLSCGGVLLACNTLFDVDSQFLLYLADIGSGEGFLGVNGAVAWRKELENGDDLRFRHRMGVRFVELPSSTQARLDNFVVEALENQLLSLDPGTLNPDFVRREQLVL